MNGDEISDERSLRLASSSAMSDLAGWTATPGAMGVSGSRWLVAALPTDFELRVDLKWPEHAAMEWGEDWWIPVPDWEKSNPCV
jgi:hypothetical protein